MISIVAARGCYGHHLANILAVGTNLTTITDFFPLSSAGDSHSIRDNLEISTVLTTRHFRYLIQPPVWGEQFVIIEPNRDHVLDYLDNSFSKESNYLYNDWISERLINRELIPERYFVDIVDFLKSNQVWTADARNLAPENKSWMIREFLSYRIDELMFNCYERYFMLTYKSKIKSTDFFDNFESALVELVDSLGLRLKIPLSKICAHNNVFVANQKFHNMQNFCDSYVNAVLTGDKMKNPCISIFDEAYVQSRLRHHGWEIMVDDLNRLPDSRCLSNLIYKSELKK